MSDGIFDYGDESLESDTHSDSGVAELSRLVTQLSQAEIQLERSKAQVKVDEEAVKDLKQRRIPDLMDELGMVTFETKGNMKVSIKNVVRASITDKTRIKAIEWFNQQNLSRMVKNEFTLKLSQGAKVNKGEENEEDAAAAVKKVLQDMGLDYKSKPNVYHSTLAAFVREKDAAGEDTPDELFNTFRYREAKIG